MTNDQFPVVIPIELIERITRALVDKCLSAPSAGFTQYELITSIVRTVVADTCLIIEGSVPLEAYEGREPHTQRRLSPR